MANINELMEGWSYGKQTDIVTAEGYGGHLASHQPQHEAVGQGPSERGRPGGNRQGPRVPDATFQVALQHADLRDLEVRLVGISSVGDGLLAGQRDRHRQRAVQVHRRPSPAATNPTGLELPYFSFVQQIRPGGSAVLDEILAGCALKGWKLSIENCRWSRQRHVLPGCVTTGQYTSPSGITLPAVATPHEFNAGMISALTFNGINYLTGGSGKQFVSMDASWENNFRPGFFPGRERRTATRSRDVSSGATAPSPCSLWCASRPDRPSTRT